MKDDKINLATESSEAMDVEDLLNEYDKESSKLRDLRGTLKTVSVFLAIAMSTFHLYTAYFGSLLSVRQRTAHVIFAFVLGFLLYPANEKKKKNRASIIDYLFIILTVVVFGYLFAFPEEIALKAGSMTSIDMLFGALAILITLEITRRAVGAALPIVAIVFLLYAYLGPYLPGVLAHRGFSIQRIISHMYMGLEGIMGIPISVSASFVFMFILFGAVLDKTGVGKFFIDVAYGLTGHLKSGPAMTAVVASGLMGSISGSSVANTVTTGAFTIPLMKKLGYKPNYAGAVEATASTGGQIMPPVMGAAAFIMAEFTGIPYLRIISAAAIPAILYYFAVGTMVHLEASKLGLKGIPKDELPKLGPILKKQGYLVLPLVIIIAFLISGFTPVLAAFWAIVITLAMAAVASIIKKDKSFTWRDLLAALEAGGKGAITVACACACAGIIVGVVTLTGLGLRVAGIIVSVAGGNLLLTLFFTMIASIILGMGLPTTAKYIVLATMAVPALIQLDVNLMSAHLFILYFGVVADITPPVALVAYAGAGIAGSNSMKTGFQAVKLALAAFIVPYIFALDSTLILVEDVVAGDVVFVSLFTAIPVILTAILGILSLGIAVESYMIDYCKFYERIAMFVAAVGLLVPGSLTDIIGLVVLVGVYMLQKQRLKKVQTAA